MTAMAMAMVGVAADCGRSSGVGSMSSRKGRHPAREVSSSPEPPPSRDYIDLSDDSDDERGTADLTLGIIAKAESRGRRHEVVDLVSDEEELLEEGELNDEPAAAAAAAAAGAVELEMEPETPAVTVAESKWKKKKEKRTKEATAGVVNMEDESTETKLPDAEQSLNMRKLLRGPRYFDPPEEQGEMCYSCGQIGHRAADCTEQPRQKPCYVCGNFGHDGYDCAEKTECFECGKSGHVARVCPNKYSKPRSSTGACLLCGRLGHDASSCSGEYDPDDIKQVHCYMCKRRGHLCCIEVSDASPTPVSCYQCGDLGHTGVGCNRQSSGGGDRGEKPTLCFKCGQEGHFARDCHQMNRDYNNKQRRHSWPAPWPVDNGRDRESPVTPACHIRPPSFKSRLAQASAGKYKEYDDSRYRDYDDSRYRVYDDSRYREYDDRSYKDYDDSRRGSKRKRYDDEDDRWTPRSTDSRHRRSRD